MYAQAPGVLGAEIFFTVWKELVEFIYVVSIRLYLAAI